jgi:uncharacterized protein (DUF433 family)
MIPRFEYITSNPAILGGKPILKGTRISVEFIMELIESGASVNDIVENYPHLKKTAIQEAVSYAIAMMKNDVIYETVVAA